MVAMAAPTRQAGAVSWRYEDARGEHVVQAGVVRDALGLGFLARETAPREPTGEVLERFELGAWWEATVHRAELETRLAALGAYVERVSRRRVAPLAGLPLLDTRPAPLAAPPPATDLHCFHDARRDRQTLLVHTRGAAILRLRLDGEVPLDLVHGPLPLTLQRSVLAREHLRLARDGAEKLVHARDLALVLGPDWEEDLLRALRDALRGVAVAKPEGPALPVDGVLDGAFARVLLDPRVADVEQRYLAGGERDALVERGEHAVRRAVAAMRLRVPVAEQHLLTVLQASLLARVDAREGRPVAAETARVLARLDYYVR